MCLQKDFLSREARDRGQMPEDRGSLLQRDRQKNQRVNWSSIKAYRPRFDFLQLHLAWA